MKRLLSSISRRPAPAPSGDAEDPPDLENHGGEPRSGGEDAADAPTAIVTPADRPAPAASATSTSGEGEASAAASTSGEPGTPAHPGPPDHAAGPAPTDRPSAESGRDAARGPAPSGRLPSARPGFRERGRLRRRLHFLRTSRELALRDLGGLMLEVHRAPEAPQGSDLVQRKLARLDEFDRERGALETALDDHRSLIELREPGIGGTCPRCGTLHASDARFCSACGVPLAVEDGDGHHHLGARDQPASPGSPADTVGPPASAPAPPAGEPSG